MFIAPSRVWYLVIAALLVCGFVLPRILADYYLFVGNILMMYLVLAIGLDLLIGWGGQFAFAHIAFYGIGAYGTTILQVRFGLPWVIAMPAAALIAGLAGILIALPTSRMRSIYLALATFAFASAMQWAFNAWTPLTGGPDGIRIPTPTVFGFSAGTDSTAFPVVAVIVSVILAATLFITTSRFGRAVCTIRESEHVAAAAGIDISRTKALLFMLSAIYAGIAGGTLTLFQSFINPDVFGFWQIVLVLTMIVVGGMGTLPGVAIGVVLIGILPEILRATMSNLLLWQEMAYGLILMLAVMFLPEGIWGFVTALVHRGRR